MKVSGLGAGFRKLPGAASGLSWRVAVSEVDSSDDELVDGPSSLPANPNPASSDAEIPEAAKPPCQAQTRQAGRPDVNLSTARATEKDLRNAGAGRVQRTWDFGVRVLGLELTSYELHVSRLLPVAL